MCIENDEREGLIDDVESLIDQFGIAARTANPCNPGESNEVAELSERLLAVYVNQENVLDTYKEMFDGDGNLTEANQTINAMRKTIGELDAELMKANTDLSWQESRASDFEKQLAEQRQKNHDMPQTIRGLATRLDQLTIRIAATEKTQMNLHGGDCRITATERRLDALENQHIGETK